jgi:ubiquinone/menaquinone biosynthesis C-methylase UbiE
MQSPPTFYDEVFDPAFAGSDSYIRFRSVAHTLAAKAELIVDVGCGRGAWVADGLYRPLEDMRGDGRTVIGIDIDPVGEENKTIDEFRLIDGSGRWPLEDASVDLALCDMTIEHVTDPPPFVRELTRVLKPGGAFIARSVSRHSLLATAARLVPNEKHPEVVARLQPTRQAADVFPTAYHMNTEKEIGALFDADYEWSVAHCGGLHHYFGPWPRMARAIAALEPRLPKAAQTTIVLCARKKPLGS